jgi:hypothetical protein
MALPAPRTWSDGEEPDNIPTADDLNTDWRDSLNFLLGTDRPIILLFSTVATALATNTITNIEMNNERLKRGGMVHSNVTNNHQITVPYTGQYQGYTQAGYTSTTVTSTRLITRLFKTPAAPVMFARTEDAPQRTTGWSVNMSFTVDLTAGDIVYMTCATSSGTAVMDSGTAFNSRFGMWYAGDST